MFGLVSKSARRARLKKVYDRYQLNPGESESLAVGRELLAAGRLKDAFRWSRKARSHFPASRRIERLYTEVKRRRTAAALRQAEARAKRSSSAECLVRYADVLRIAGRTGKAFRVLRRAERAHPGSWEVHQLLGKLHADVYTRKRSPKAARKAVEQLEAALAACPGEPTTLLLLAMTLTRLGNWSEAASVAEELRRIVPDDPRVRTLIAHIRQHSTFEVGSSDGGTRAPGATGDDGLDAVMSIPGAVGVFSIDAEGQVTDRICVDNRCFDLSDPADTVEGLAATFHLDVRRLGLGEVRSCTVRGDGWNMGYMPLGTTSVMAFFEGEVSEEQIAVDMESVLGGATTAAAAS